MASMERFCFLPKEFLLLLQTKKTGSLTRYILICYIYPLCVCVCWLGGGGGGEGCYMVDGYEMGIYECP